MRNDRTDKHDDLVGEILRVHDGGERGAFHRGLVERAVSAGEESLAGGELGGREEMGIVPEVLGSCKD